jgi:hypothetical protein
MVVRDGRPRYRPSIRTCPINAAGCTRCATFSKRCGSATTTQRKREPKPCTRPRTVPRPKPPSAGSGHWETIYPGMVKRLGTDLPELLSFYRFPRHLWRRLRTDECHRARFRRSASANATHGLLCERGERRPDQLFDLPPVQFGLAHSHPPPFYTSRLTSPGTTVGSPRSGLSRVVVSTEGARRIWGDEFMRRPSFDRDGVPRNPQSAR